MNCSHGCLPTSTVCLDLGHLPHELQVLRAGCYMQVTVQLAPVPAYVFCWYKKSKLKTEVQGSREKHGYRPGNKAIST